jgi:hypothetical protein
MESDGFLHRYFLNNSGKRLHKWFHYFDIYERHFQRFRGAAPIVLEIGVRGGGSLEMWRAYFGESSRVVGIDIEPECKAHEGEGIEVFIGSQDDPQVIDRVLASYPRFDIVIDDGSHMMQHMIASFQMLYPKLTGEGVYLVEDTHVCYDAKYGGGLKRAGSFIEMVKDKLDEINAPNSKGGLPVSEFARSTDSICCYNGVIVFERKPQGRRQAVITHAL